MAERPRYPKSHCCVPGCRRWSTRFKSEWLCGDHWPLVPRALKAFRTKRLKQIYARWAKANAQYRLAAEKLREATLPDGRFPAVLADASIEALRVERRAARAWYRADKITWERMKRTAIQKAAGI